MDLSFSGYLMLLAILIQLLALPGLRRFCYACISWQFYILIPVFTALLLGDANLFRYWGGHINSEAIAFLNTPEIILNSLHWLEIFLFFVVWIVISVLFLFGFKHLIIPKRVKNDVFSRKQTVVKMIITMFIGALMIIPIRGSFSVAPINTGVAYFSKYLFANNAAINPLWNLAYSLKRSDVSQQEYSLMEEDKAQELFSRMMRESGNFHSVLKNDRPDIVVILLEGFSGQAIGAMGGADVTPNFDKLIKEGLFFNNVYSASFRSDYGMVGVLAGYPGFPGYSIMQYPEKSKNLNFLPRKLEDAGYVDFNFLYGGDMAFKNLKSLVSFAGFDDVVDIDDFPSAYRGEKWGVHDQYAFNRFLSLVEESESPSFNYLFTLSSHEPFDVPMERVYEDDYLNSVHYTDRCLGDFFQQVKTRGLWDNTLFILVADHGVVGPQKAGYNSRERYHIPMLWTGGAVAALDTVVSKYASQIDLSATLLRQLNIDASEFRFSKNILDNEVEGFAFLHYTDGFGYVDENVFQMYDKGTLQPLEMHGAESKSDSLRAKVIMQIVNKDFRTRLTNGRK